MARQPFLPTCSNAGVALGPGLLDQRPLVAASIARCIALWSDVDVQRGRLLAGLLKANAAPTIAAFLALSNSRAQERVLSAAAGSALDSSTLTLFQAIMNVGRKYQGQRNDLAHGIFGVSEAIPDGVLWMRAEHRIENMIETQQALIKSPHDALQVSLDIKKRIFVYQLTTLNRLGTQILDYHKLVYDFIGLISRETGTSRDELYNQLCALPDVQGEIDRLKDSQ